MIEDIKNKYSIDDHLCFLVNDDNFKAMSVLLNKFENGIGLVYIDPPFNTNAIIITKKKHLIYQILANQLWPTRINLNLMNTWNILESVLF